MDTKMRTANYSPAHDRQVVTNQPDYILKCTGNYELDIHGCWWEHIITKFKKSVPDREPKNRQLKIGDKVWMVGHYPRD